MSVVVIVNATATVLTEPPSKDWSSAWRLLFVSSFVSVIILRRFLHVLLHCESTIQVFKTESKGWGVRTWDTILPGALICEYTGVLRRTAEVEGLLENNYIFDIDCLQTIKGLDGREVWNVSLLVRQNCRTGPFYMLGFPLGSETNLSLIHIFGLSWFLHAHDHVILFHWFPLRFELATEIFNRWLFVSYKLFLFIGIGEAVEILRSA